jgi:choline dehydrogenase
LAVRADPPLARRPASPRKVEPGPERESAADLLAYARARGGTIFHPSSTCAMGPARNPMAVVDHELRVRGLDALRVADASIMPTVVSGNTNAACIMIGEKCADMMLAAG